jgi:peroxiredoxin
MLVFAVCFHPTKTVAGDAEFTGKLDPVLTPNEDELDDIVFKPVPDVSKLKFTTPLEKGVSISVALLYNPVQGRKSLLALLVESKDEPVLYADLDANRTITDNEKFKMKEEDNPYIFSTNINVPFDSAFFKTFPVHVKYFKDVKFEDMTDGERLVLQSSEAFAKGKVDIKGKQTVVLYGFEPGEKKINPNYGLLGVDSDGDGEVDVEKLSPEVVEARDETVIFRAGQNYVSTKKVDLEKNLIIMREHPASDYKRVELRMGAQLPDFTFTDLSGKKRKLSDFRGKYVLVDFWGLWCPPCRRELPYLRTAYVRFQKRNFEILGMNTDTDFDPKSLNDALKKNGIMWTQARLDSIKDVIRNYRIHSFPTTLLIDPEGKIISLGQKKKDQPSLRGKDLIKSLDEILPQ